MGPESPTGIPGRPHFPCGVTTCGWRNSVPPVWLPWEWPPGLSPLFSPGLYPSALAGLTLYPFAVIDHSYRQDYVLSSVTLPGELLNLQMMVLGDV